MLNDPGPPANVSLSGEPSMFVTPVKLSEPVPGLAVSSPSELGSRETCTPLSPGGMFWNDSVLLALCPVKLIPPAVDVTSVVLPSDEPVKFWMSLNVSSSLEVDTTPGPPPASETEPQTGGCCAAPGGHSAITHAGEVVVFKEDKSSLLLLPRPWKVTALAVLQLVPTKTLVP